MFPGLYLQDSLQNTPETYPIGTAVTLSTNTTKFKGYVLGVPSHNPDNNDPLYTINIIDGDTTKVPASAMPHMIDTKTTTLALTLPSWLQHDSKVR